jgi:dihydroorotase-like cyclic amidohydrolase
MSSLLIRNVHVVQPGQRILPGDVLVRDGRIASVGAVGGAVGDATVVEGAGRLLTP